MTLTDAERDYLAGQPLGRLATRRPDGTLQNSPVGFRYDEATGTLDVRGWDMGSTRKFANVADNGQVALVVDDLASRKPWTVRGVEVRGTAEALTGLPPGPRGESGEVIRIHPRRVVSWGLDGTRTVQGRDVPTAAGPARTR